MKLSELPRLHHALSLMGIDNGSDPQPNAIIPDAWHSRALQAEAELIALSHECFETLVIGEHTEQQEVAKSAPAADEILVAAFDDGELAELFFEPWTGIHDARAAEKRHAERDAALTGKEG